MKLEPSESFPSCNQIVDSSILHRFMLGGQATLILLAPSGTYHTYCIDRPKNQGQFPDDVRFVYCLHQGKKFYLGMIEGDEFRLTAHSRFLPESEVVKGAYYLMKLAANQLLLSSTKMQVFHTGKCARCGRSLSGAKALSWGFGKKCLQRVIIKELANPEGLKTITQQLSLADIWFDSSNNVE